MDRIRLIAAGVALGCCAALVPCRAAPDSFPGFAPSSATPAADAAPASAALAPSGAWSRLQANPGFGTGLVDAYLVGAVLGLADYAGLHRVDHPVRQETSGIWSIAKAGQFPAELIGLTAAGAIWTGGRSRFGRTLWQSLDAAAMAGISTQALKWTFQRTRPSDTTNPDLWFQGIHNQSFPSGDVSSITALVTPIILEYHRTDPGVDALAAIPVYDMVARMKAHGHWLTDTLAGAAVGVVSGWIAHRAHSPFILGLLPHGFDVGLREHFR